MKRNPLYILLCLFVSLTFIVACNNDDFSTNSSLKLAFSNDTLRLDTILTGIGTSTRQLKVYNRNKESLVISSITLADGSNSGFRINVDGMKGSNFSNIHFYRSNHTSGKQRYSFFQKRLHRFFNERQPARCQAICLRAGFSIPAKQRNHTRHLDQCPTAYRHL